MSTWEERMSQRAKARQAATLAVESEAWEEWTRREIAHWEKTMPALPGENRVLEAYASSNHVGHLDHWCSGGFMCSCGRVTGVATYVIPEDYEPKPCEICKARKIGAFAEAVGESTVT